MGEVAPGCVLPTCGFGHHQLAARPCARGRSVAAVPMNGSMSSRMAALYLRLTPWRFPSDELIVDLDMRRPGAGIRTDQPHFRVRDQPAPALPRLMDAPNRATRIGPARLGSARLGSARRSVYIAGPARLNQ